MQLLLYAYYRLLIVLLKIKYTKHMQARQLYITVCVDASKAQSVHWLEDHSGEHFWTIFGDFIAHRELVCHRLSS